MSDIIIETRHINKSYKLSHNKINPVLKDVSISLHRGETLGLVGQSGCGKSTLAKILMRFETEDSGQVLFDSKDLTGISNKDLRPYRKRMQMVFQDPASSLDPRMKIKDIIAEPLNTWRMYASKSQRENRIKELLDMVELKETALERYPHQFSGGQKQRICIARALALEPELLICDESVSALDVSVQAQILNLLKQLKLQLGLSCLFISHNMAVVDFISDRVCRMEEGKLLEAGKR